MKYLQILILFLFVSCNNEKVVQLPEIDHSEISEILDVSPAYLFYDETQEDHIELNRKSLIITTNWLVNVDKRLSLKQAIPKIVYLQEKKRNSELHKNEDAKNYYTCHNTSINNLGFIEFTNVFYVEKPAENFGLESYQFAIVFHDPSRIEVKSSETENNFETSIESFIQDLKNLVSQSDSGSMFHLYFSKDLSFQDYISFKSALDKLKDQKVIIINEEFIF
ncbi:hypothetical protein OS188_09970 [Xanthomarina sp. F1114]|uniref:hypothetical protein n=1 Tax=Xanthomarina sp. F1114 TaxID=2996019 RepID=UPI00225DDBFC|nr:hypothetical protein [Xanthomarina sp. F1114]MCX7548278.1 hypothetical protein [Xanthomarina sp. F1114]